ncbi:Slp family lipoprotein [Candidatus Regiella endosymbiont of Tuberolachnus salignus]|uniref:Slp family lipoprotein n=1 Tax=Candidatus Regiella endosymbiont of Tuberolachnus salignus TaxID=3077956 RepID=UPI0030D556A8
MKIEIFSAKFFFAVLATLLLTGCVNIPKEIQGKTETPQQNLNLIKNTPRAFIGQEGRFGGTVVNVTNERQRTRLEITSIPLDRNAKPMLTEPSQGRIIAYVNAFLTPADFQYRLVTVIGTISGVETGKIGTVPYDFIVINTSGYKRWYSTEQRMMASVLMEPLNKRQRAEIQGIFNH